jgi:tight adherence protein C
MNALLISILFGLVITLVVWNTFRIFSEVPHEDRSFLDRPPTGFRLIWPLVRAFEHYFGPLMAEATQQRYRQRLRRAGVDYMLSPTQFFAGKVVAAVLVTLVSLLMVQLFFPGWMIVVPLLALAGFYYPELWLKETTDHRNRSVFRALPFYLDIVTLSVEAGSNLTGGLGQAVRKAPDSPLRQEVSRVLRDIRAGRTRAEALRDFADRVGTTGVANVVSSMIQAERTGSNLGPVLRAQSEQLRNARFLQAEKLAMEAPVKLLGPLILFIFPTTFLVLSFVIMSKAIHAGVVTWGPLLWAYSWRI